MHKLYDHGVYVFAVGDRTVPERVPTSGKAVYSGLSTLASGGGSSFDYSVAGTATL